MNIFDGFEQNFSNSIVTVGSFDGVHKGHQLLIERLNIKADELSLEPIVVTFDPHPRSVLRGNNRLLSTIDEKLFLFERYGVRNVVVAHFDANFAKISAQEFIQHYIIDKLHAKALFMGDGHFFGKDRGGDAELLKGYPLSIFHLDRFDNISSTAVRTAIEMGDMANASRLLGDGYLVSTPIKNPEKLLPQSGQYQCVTQHNETLLMSIENIKNIDTTGLLFLVR